MASDAAVVLDGLAYGESPRWHDGQLWFCNWGTGQIVVMPEPGRSEVVAAVESPLPYCIDWTSGGALLVVDGPTATVRRLGDDGAWQVFADLSEFGNVFNEIVVDGRGTAYVNGGRMDPAAGQVPPGVVVAITPDGTARQVADGIRFGNGMAVTPDNGTLIVAESHAMCLTAFDIAADGTLSNRRVWADLGGDNPDGICLDAEGAVWYASVPGQHAVRVREGGDVLDRVPVDRGAFACELGGDDGRDLYILASVYEGMDRMDHASRNGVVLRARVDVPAAT